MALPQRQSLQYNASAPAPSFGYDAAPNTINTDILAPLPYGAPIAPSVKRDPRVRQLTQRKPSRFAWLGQLSMLLFLGFGLLQLTRALAENMSDIWLLSQEASHIVAYHEAATTTQSQLANALRYYSSQQGQQALIRNELGYVSDDEILIKYR